METVLTVLFGLLAIGVLVVTTFKILGKKIPMVMITVGKYGLPLLILVTLIYYLFIH